MASFSTISIRFNADFKQFSSQMQNAQRSMRKYGQQMQNVGRNLTIGLTAPIVALGYKSVRTFADFEQALAKVQAVSGATGREMKYLRGNAEDLGATTRFAASEVAELQLNLSKIGFDPSEILKATDSVLELSLATGEDLAQSATVAASTLRGFELEASETNRVVDVMADSFSSSALDLGKFQTAMAVLAPVAKTAKQSIEQTTGMLSVLVNAGIDASTAGTGLRNIFLDIAAKGINLKDALKKIETSTNKNATAMDLFGKRGATVGTVLANNYEEAKEFAVQFDNAGGAAKRMAEIMDNTLEGSLFRLKSAMESFYITLGEQLAPVISELADKAGSLISKFKDLSSGTKKAIVVVAGLAAAVGPLLATLGFLVANILPALATGFTVLTGPIGLVIAAIAGIGVVIYKNWDRIKKEIVSLRNYFTDLYNESLVVRIGVEQIVMVFNTLYNVAKLVIDIIITGFTKGAEFILESFKNIGAGLKAVLTGDITAIPGIFKRQADLAGRNFAALFVGISKDVSEFTKNMETDFKGSLDRIQKKTKLEFSADVTIDKIKTKKEGTDEVGDPAKDGVKGRGLVESVNEMNALPQIISPLDALEAKLPEQSELIKNTFDGFKNGMVDISGALNNALESSIGSTAQFMGDFVGNIITGQASAKDALSGLMSIVAGFMENLGQAMIAAGVASEAFKNILGSGIGAIIAGTALVALSKVVANIMSGGPSSSSGGGNRRVALANGGIAYGPTNALIGEYSGASNNPEVVAPLDKLRSMISDSAGASDVNVSGGFVLRGNDLLASIDRSKTRKNRRGA